VKAGERLFFKILSGDRRERDGRASQTKGLDGRREGVPLRYKKE